MKTYSFPIGPLTLILLHHLCHTIHLFKFCKVILIFDQHNLRKFTGLNIFKTSNLFAVANAAAQDGFLPGFIVFPEYCFLFLKNTKHGTPPIT